ARPAWRRPSRGGPRHARAEERGAADAPLPPPGASAEPGRGRIGAPPGPRRRSMKITAVRASWLSAAIPADRAHVSDFGRNDSFNTCLVEIETGDGLTGLGEAKIAVGNLGHYSALVALVREEIAPLLIGRDPRDVAAIWEALYNGSRAHYALR